MILRELIVALEAEVQHDRTLPLGFGNPHSYRGYYDELAFEPLADITIGEMLADARTALGTTYQGWKGGDYTMDGYTDCWLAQQGDTGETIGPVLFALLMHTDALAEEELGELRAFAAGNHRWGHP